MFSLILLIIFGIGAALFATQNSQTASVFLGQYGLMDVPIYLVVLAGVLFGIFVSWVISLGGFISHSLTLRGKEGRIRDAEHEISTLRDQIHTLEMENERLRGENVHPVEAGHEEEVAQRQLNPFTKLRERFS